MAVVVNLGTVKPAAQNPEVEDYVFDPQGACIVEIFSPKQFWEMLTKLAEPKLSTIFGDDLIKRGPRSCGVDPGKGKASLSCLVPHSRPILYLETRYDKPKIRIAFSDGDFALDLSMIYIWLYGDDLVTPDEKAVERIAMPLRNADDAILSVGLTRPFRVHKVTLPYTGCK